MKNIITVLLFLFPFVTGAQAVSKTPTPQTEGWFILTNDPAKTYDKIIATLQAAHKSVKIKENRPIFTVKTEEIKGNYEGAYEYDISYSKYDTLLGFYFEIIFNADNGYKKTLTQADYLFQKALAPFADSFEIVYLSPNSTVELPVNKMLVTGTKDYYLNKAGNQTIAAEVIFVASSLLTILAATQKDGGQELYVVSTAGLATSVAFKISAGVNLKRAAKALK